jgi:transcriptional regulator with XRE-family HTH domain
MEDLKQTVARNLSDLRKKKSWTQAELAERLNYSDKAVSKWERGESLPDVVILKQIADLFEVTVDFLLAVEHPENAPASRRKSRNRRLIAAISTMTVWLIACILFFSLGFIGQAARSSWLIFLAAVPVSCIVLLIFSALWWRRRWLFTTISVLIWSALLFIFLLVFSITHLNIWLIFVIGVPAQIIIFLWSGLKKE